MANIDLSGYSKAELEDLQKTVAKALKDYDARMRAEALEAVQEMAASHGFKLDELLGEGKPRKAAIPPKYKHPDSPSLTWSGRGRPPQWFKDALAAGSTVESLLIGG